MPNAPRYNWKHNSLIGLARLATINVVAISTAQSTSNEAHALAKELAIKLRQLERMIAEARVNQDGTTSYFGETS